MPTIKLFTDGACSTSTNKGGWAVIGLNNNKIIHKYCGYNEDTTNNRMELTAIISALTIASAYPQHQFVICSDSAYCINMCKDWIWKWATNGWKNSKKQIVENYDLVKIIYDYLNPCGKGVKVTFEKVKGHNGQLENELADALCSRNENKWRKLVSENGLSDCWE